jgi:hypothetical protein
MSLYRHLWQRDVGLFRYLFVRVSVRDAVVSPFLSSGYTYWGQGNHTIEREWVISTRHSGISACLDCKIVFSVCTNKKCYW